IFRDPQLRRYGKFSEQLAQELSSTAVFVCILSPNYVGSDWCQHELQEFYNRFGGGRVIKVVKTGFDAESCSQEVKTLLANLDEVLECRFYKENDVTGRFEDLLPEVIPAHRQDFIGEVDVIVQNIEALLKTLRGAVAVQP